MQEWGVVRTGRAFFVAAGDYSILTAHSPGQMSLSKSTSFVTSNASQSMAVAAITAIAPENMHEEKIMARMTITMGR